MADGKIEFETKINENGLKAGLTKLKTAIKEIGNGSLVKGIGNLGMAFTGVTGAVKAGIDAAKAAKAVMDDLAETYKVQTQAETQLQQAAKNNPYLLSENVAALKNYAGELQSISTYGDEELLPFMAQLAASGRTQQEIMDIMSASVNVAASGMMSLDSAVFALNGTYNGNIGLLGRQIGELKGLTAEQLKNGDAVKIVLQKYNGMAAEVAKATGTSQQLKNAMGDLKEELGAPFEKAMSPIRAFFTELIGGWASAKKAKREYKEAKEANEKGKGNTATLQTQIEGLERELEARKKEFEELTDPEKMKWKVANGRGYVSMDMLKTANENYAKRTAEMEDLLARRKKQLEQAQIQEKQASDKAQADAKAAEEKTQTEAEIEARDKLRAAYDETLRQKQEEINQRRINGEEITAEAEAQEMYNTAFAAYIKMMSDPAFAGNSGNYSHEINARAQIADWGEIAGGGELKKQVKDFEDELQRAADEAAGIVKSHYDTVLEALDAEYTAVINNKYLEEEEKLRIEKEYADKRGEIVKAKDEAEKANLQEKINNLTTQNETYWTRYKAKKEEIASVSADIDKYEADKKKEIQEQYKGDEEGMQAALVALDQETAAMRLEVEEAYSQNRKEMIAGVMGDVANYTSQTVNIMKDAANLMSETLKNQTDAELATLEEKYRKGEISEEEYEEKKTEIKKDAARQQYKIDMATWAANILQATANIALGITQAIAQGGVAGIITGALVGAAGAVQIASIIASKPTPPSFATGGFIGGANGATLGDDNTYIHARRGEWVVNAMQQRKLLSLLNAGGSSGGGGGTNIVIHNSASNLVSAQPQITKDKIELLIDARVNDGLKNGRYSTALNQAQSGMSGDFYGI